MIIPHNQTPATTTTTSSALCFICGTIKKSGKLSCCARGGSWFGNCGATGNAKLQHTWHEGIQACKARQPNVAAMDRQQKTIQRNHNNSDDDVNNVINSKIAIAVAHTFAFTSAETPILDTNAVPDHSSAAYDTGSTPSKIIIAKTTSATHTSTKVPAKRMPANPLITLSVNGPIIPPVNSIITPPGHVEASTDFTPFHKSVARECANFVSMFVTIYMSLAFAFC